MFGSCVYVCERERGSVCVYMCAVNCLHTVNNYTRRYVAVALCLTKIKVKNVHESHC